MSLETPPVDAQVEETGPCSRKVTICVPQARVDAEIETAFRNVASSVQFPGFRQGKAPRKLVEARLGDRVLEEVKQRLVETAVEEAVDRTKLQRIGPAKLDWDKLVFERGRDFRFEVAVDVRPTFEPPKLDALVVKRPDLTVRDADVDREVDRLRAERATIRDGGDEPLAERGIATMTVRITVGDATVVDASDVEWQHGDDVLGGMAVDGLSAGLLGRRKGESAEFRQKLPDDFRDEQHRGAEALIALRIDGVQHVDLPPADDAFATEMDYDDVADMRAELRKKLERSAEAGKERALDQAIVDALLAATPFEVPPSLVQTETERMLRRYEMQLRRQGVPEEAIVDQLRAMVGAAAVKVTRDLRASFVLDRIAADRKVLVTESETRQEIAATAARYDRSVAEMEDYMDRNGLMSALRGELREKKTLAELRGVVRIED